MCTFDSGEPGKTAFPPIRLTTTSVVAPSRIAIDGEPASAIRTHSHSTKWKLRQPLSVLTFRPTRTNHLLYPPEQLLGHQRGMMAWHPEVLPLDPTDIERIGQEAT